MIIITGPFGPVFDLWCNDMRLEPIIVPFMVVFELDFEINIVEDKIEMVEDEVNAQMDEEVLAHEML